MDTNLPRIQTSDPAVVSAIVGQLKSQGIFDEFRRDCIADVDTKPAYQNLRQRVEIYVSKFLSQQTWCTDLNKNQLRDNLRRSINESGVLAWGIDHLVEQIVTPKIYHVFYPQIEAVVKEYLGLEDKQCHPNLSVPPPGMNEMQEKSIDPKPSEPKEETKSSKELQQFLEGSKLSTTCNAGINEQSNTGEGAQTFANMSSKTPNESFDKVSVKLEERAKSPTENKDENAESTNLLKVKSDLSDSIEVMKSSSENKVHCQDEQKKISVDKKLEQDNHLSVTEKSKNVKEKDKETKLKKERSTSESSDKDTQKSLAERKDHLKASTQKKSGNDSIKTEREKKLDKHKPAEKEKLKSDSAKLKEGKKHENEKAEKKLIQKSDMGKSVSDSLKLKHSKSVEAHKKSHKNEGSYSKSSTHNTDSLKSHKSDGKVKIDSNSKLQKSSDHKSINKLDKTEKLKFVKSDSKGKSDQENSKPRSDPKQKSSNETLPKPSKHSSESKSKHSDNRIKSHGTQEKPINKQTLEKKLHISSSSQKSENSDKTRHTTSDKKHPERTKSIELSEDSSKSECPEPKRIKLDQSSTSGHKKSDKHLTSHSHIKQSSEKEKKSDSSKDRSKTQSDKQKTSKSNEKPKIFHKEKSTDNISNKIDKEKSIERKSSVTGDKIKTSSSSEKQKLSSSTEKQKLLNSSDKQKTDDYRHSKEKKKEKIREMKREKCSKKVKTNQEGSLRTNNEGFSKTKDSIVKAKHDIDYSHSVSQKWKIQGKESLDSKDCEKQSPCCNFSPEACSESESHSSKGSDILLNIRPILGISPSQEGCYESINDNERSKSTSEVLGHLKEFDLEKDQARASSDEYEDTSKITQDGKDGCISRILNEDEEDGAWSDVTISSVHTSDLSSFDDRISLSSSEEIEEENSQKEKKKVPLKEIKKLTESNDKDHGDTSFSEDEKSKHKAESSRKQTSSEKSSSSSFSRCFDFIGGKRDDVPNVEPKVEHKWELRRQRKINPRYASDEFSSIFNSSKWSYSNNLDIGDSDTYEPTEKTPARKNSHGSRGDLTHHVDSDNGISRTSSVDKCEIDESDHKRKRSRLRSSESEQGEKGPSIKRQKFKEEIKSETKEQTSDFRCERGIIDDSEIRNRFSKRTNQKSLEEENHSQWYKDDAFLPFVSVTNINLERSQFERTKYNKRINLKSPEENSVLCKDESCHINTAVVDIWSERAKCDKAKQATSTEVRDKYNKRTNLKSSEEEENSPHCKDDACNPCTYTGIQPEREVTNTTDNSEIRGKYYKRTNIKSEYNSLPAKDSSSTVDIQSEKSHSEMEDKCIPSQESSYQRYNPDENQERTMLHAASENANNKDASALPADSRDSLS